MVKVIILSLHDSPRREVITKRLNNRGIVDFEFYDAFDARNMGMSELSKLFDVKKFQKTYGRIPARGEIGCTLSHLGIWKRISESNCDNWVVLEDDALPTHSFHKILNLNINAFIIIGQSKVSWIKSKLIFLKYRLKFVKKNNDIIFGRNSELNMRGTVGYYVTKATCKKLTDTHRNSKPFFCADDYLVISKSCDLFHTKKFYVYEDYKNMNSNIQAERAECAKRSKKGSY